MPLRTRLKRAFTRGSTDDDSQKTPKPKKINPKFESIHYQPGEKMPPLKYRRPVAPEHKAKLESFSWAKAWRRHSQQSIYSPMGSRMPSRKTSYSTLGRRSMSLGRRSVGRKSNSREGGSTLGVDSGFGGSVDDSRPEMLREGSDEEGDVLNVGLSRNNTEDPRRPRKSSSIHRGRDRRPSSLPGRRSLEKTRREQSLKSGSSRPQTGTSTDRTRSKNSDIPFSPEDLEMALRRSHLEAPKEESDRSGDGSPASPAHASVSKDEPALTLRPREIQFVD